MAGIDQYTKLLLHCDGADDVLVDNISIKWNKV